MLVSQLSSNLLPKEFLNCLPKVCPFCGQPTEITDGLTALSCTNAFCKSKLTERMLAMLGDLGVKNLGSSKCQMFIEAYDIASPLALFEFANTDGTAKNVLYDGCSQEFSDSIAAQINEKRKKLLWEYVRIANLPGIRDSAKKLFDGYVTVEDFYADMEDTTNGGILFISKKLGIATTEEGYHNLDSADLSKLSVKAVEVYRTLCDAKDELTYYQKFFDIPKDVADATVNICISTAVGSPYTSKSDFVDQMNKAYGDIIHINQLSSVTKQCDVLIWSKQGAPTSKVQKAVKMEKPVLTGRGFNALLALFKEGYAIDKTLAYVAEADTPDNNDIVASVKAKFSE